MAYPRLDDIRNEYLRLFHDCEVKADKVADVQQAVNTIVAGRARYERATAAITMPWWVVGIIHMREGDFDFTTHLHNGDPLTARTVHVPAGRPVANPQAPPAGPPSAAHPYSWDESAADAIVEKNFHTWNDWSIAGTLYKLEAYNGMGYRMYHPTVLSPYLWSFTTHYKKGKYKRDNVFSASLVDAQIGAAAVMKTLIDNGTIAAPSDLQTYQAERRRAAAMVRRWDAKRGTNGHLNFSPHIGPELVLPK